ncbi:MAG: hypothetical protein K8I02_07960, partial [Candidatus Methylomirabilis sp.]|nr:hypothetical protein [Deltaproteobacteria bacterium]
TPSPGVKPGREEDDELQGSLTVFEYQDLVPQNELSSCDEVDGWHEVTLEGDSARLAPLVPGDYYHSRREAFWEWKVGNGEDFRWLLDFLSREFPGHPGDPRRPFQDILQPERAAGFIGHYACRRLASELRYFLYDFESRLEEHVKEAPRRERFRDMYGGLLAAAGGALEKGLAALYFHWSE